MTIFRLEVPSKYAFGHISSLTRNIPSHCRTNVLAFSHTIYTSFLTLSIPVDFCSFWFNKKMWNEIFRI